MSAADISLSGSRISIDLVAIEGADSIALNTPVELDVLKHVGAFSFCRMCLLRMPLSPLEKVVLEAILLADETGCGHRFTYAGLGKALGRCEHSVKQAAASLRGAGLIITTRASYAGSEMSCSAGPFVSWASSLLGRLFGNVHIPAATVSDSADHVHKTDESVFKTARARSRRAAADRPAAKKKDEASAADVQPVPMPTAEDVQMAAAYDGEFDSTVERADTLRAAGRSEEDESDELSFGAETADTDMGQGVRMNPNI